MPKKFKDCVKDVQAQGKSKNSSYAICTAANAGNVRQVRQAEFKKRHAKK